MSNHRVKILWTDALRLMLIKEVKRRPIIWSSSSDNFNNMNDQMAYQITRKLHEVSTGICELTVDHIKDEWKNISDECIRILNESYEPKWSESSIWRFGNVLKFMLHAVTHTEEGNAHVLLYLHKLSIFCVVHESDIVGVLWPFSNVGVLLKGKVERATISKVGRHDVMLEKCRSASISGVPLFSPFVRNEKDDAIVYFDNETHCCEENSLKNAPNSLCTADVGENKPFSAQQLLQQSRTISKQASFCDISSLRLTRSDFLHRKRKQFVTHIGSSVSCSRPIPQRRDIASFAERNDGSGSAFPVAFSQVPIKVRKQAELLGYNRDRLLLHLDNIRCEADGLRWLVVDAKVHVDKKLDIIMMHLLNSLESLAPAAVPARDAGCKKEMKSVMVQTDEVFSEEIGFPHVGKVFGDEVYRYCPKDIVRGLVITSSHPTVFVRRLAQHIFTREEISMLFSENVTMSQMERIRWLGAMISIWYPRKKFSSLHKSCMQALSGLADYENLLLELEKGNHNLDNSGRHSIPLKRIRVDDACSSTHEENKPREEYLLYQTLSRIREKQRNAEGFAVKVAMLLYSGDDDIQKPCIKKRDQAKLIWLKEKVQEFYPVDIEKNVNYQWNRCLDALDSYANKLRNMSYDEYDSGDEFGC